MDDRDVVIGNGPAGLVDAVGQVGRDADFPYTLYDQRSKVYGRLGTEDSSTRKPRSRNSTHGSPMNRNAERQNSAELM